MGCIIEANADNVNDWITLAMKLWFEAEEAELRKEFETHLKSKKETTFLYEADGKCIGFIDVSVRADYVEGSDTTPVGYVEGIYVEPGYRKMEIAKQLIEEAEKWTKEKGCTQIASDTGIDNTSSYDFHKRVGFKEAGRIICFIKDIGAN